MKRRKPIKPEIRDILKNIDLSHLFAKRIDHAVSFPDFKFEEWKLFEPTRFIYSFFAFNMLYEINWEETLKRSFIWDARSEKYTSDKIVLLLEFIYDEKNRKQFKDFYKKYDPSFRIIENSKQIEDDKNIDREDKSYFIDSGRSYFDNYKTSVTKFDSSNFDIKDHYKILIFCYQIRNNVFHGTKKASEMIKTGQRERLIDYSSVILATIDMFFDVLKTNYNYHPAKEDELKENMGLLKY